MYSFMNKFVPLLLFLHSLTSVAQVATYTFTNADPGNQTSKAVTSTNANITASDITRGTGLTPVTATGSINSSGWTSSAQDLNDYYEFTLTPVTGHQLNLASINLTERRSGTGPTNYLIAYSIGGGTEVSISTGPLSGTIDAAINVSFTVNTVQPIRFRLYAWGASNAAGTLRLDQSLTVSGVAPLPVKLISFTGESTTNAVQLNWATSWEEKNEGFDVLKGRSATRLEKIGFVPSHTSTQELLAYSFTDNDVQDGQVYYYQLRQKDMGGSSALSTIIGVRVGAASEETKALAYPNPTWGNFMLSTQEKEIAAIHLYNSAGIEIPITINKTQAPAQLSIDVVAPTGIYHLQLQTTDGSYQQPLKIIIQ
ncbi:T9SS type A sorting domain-containing protein [Spirosoma sp. KCTC 42546]|nr:T9SS type A sorting domain-containing protein [Spirosoma sp. KCTC 42546]